MTSLISAYGSLIQCNSFTNVNNVSLPIYHNVSIMAILDLRADKTELLGRQ